MTDGQGTERASRKDAIILVVVLVVIVAVAAAIYSSITRASDTVARSQEDAGQGSAGSSMTIAVPSQSEALSAEEAQERAEVLEALRGCMVEDEDGNKVSVLDAAGGKPLIINFWATWCPYCVDEMQDYQQLYERYGGVISFVMIDAADRSNEVKAAKEYVAENGFTFPVYYDTSYAAQRLFGIRAYPTTFIIGADGELVAQIPGRIDTAGVDAFLAEWAKALR